MVIGVNYYLIRSLIANDYFLYIDVRRAFAMNFYVDLVQINDFSVVEYIPFI